MNSITISRAAAVARKASRTGNRTADAGTRTRMIGDRVSRVADGASETETRAFYISYRVCGTSIDFAPAFAFLSQVCLVSVGRGILCPGLDNVRRVTGSMGSR